MKITSRETIQVGSFDVNASIIVAENKVYLIDPGSEGARIISRLQKENLTLAAILLTHGHFDHIGAINDLEAAYPDIPVYMDDKDRPMLTHSMNQLAPDYPPIQKPKNLRCASELNGVRVLSTPGHTPGGVCYYFEEDRLLFSGDTLFAGSIGRTDFPGGDMATLMNSLEKLKSLPPETTVIPGHGPFTTIARELSGNPFLQ